jgi:hypothetical protein
VRRSENPRRVGVGRLPEEAESGGGGGLRTVPEPEDACRGRLGAGVKAASDLRWI